jgi:hypothetical protein
VFIVLNSGSRTESLLCTVWIDSILVHSWVALSTLDRTGSGGYSRHPACHLLSSAIKTCLSWNLWMSRTR